MNIKKGDWVTPRSNPYIWQGRAVAFEFWAQGRTTLVDNPFTVVTVQIGRRYYKYKDAALLKTVQRKGKR